MRCLSVALAAVGLFLLPAGAAAATHPHVAGLSHGGITNVCGVAVDRLGFTYVADYTEVIYVYGPTGSLITQFEASTPCGLAVSSDGLLYVNAWQGPVTRYAPSKYPPTIETTYSKDLSLNGSGVLSNDTSYGVAVDPSNDHVYLAHADHVAEYTPSGALLTDEIATGLAGAQYFGVDVYGKTHDVYVTDGASSKAYVFSASDPTGPPVVSIDASGTPDGSMGFGPYGTQPAVDQSNGHLYVFDANHLVVNEFDQAGQYVSQIVHAFEYETNDVAVAPPASPNPGFVFVTSLHSVDAFDILEGRPRPSVAIEPVTEIGSVSARLNAVVNPKALPNSVHFEWKAGTGGDWAGAASTPGQSLPEEDVELPASAELDGLQPATLYEVRAVAANSDGLSVTSASTTFTTEVAPPPTVEPLAVSSVGETSAQIATLIDPMGDQVQWRVEVSHGESCDAPFALEPVQTIPPGEPAPVAVESTLEELLAGRQYCVRVSAANSGGTTLSPVETFVTTVQPPTQVATAFAAPRTDTSARLNGRVNPEGAELRYHFEYSADGGGTWTALPVRTDESGARHQIVVADQLAGLQPETSYLYRFIAENRAGPAPQGEVKALTTRSSGEMALPKRGIELVNPPDKGNQNVFTVEVGREEGFEGDGALGADGDYAAWSVPGGAPGGTIGSGNIFLARRGPSGWHSTSFIPAADQQAGGGDLHFSTVAISPGGSRAVLYGYSGFLTNSDLALVRSDLGNHQELLATYPNDNVQELGNHTEATSDLEHVLVFDDDTGVIQDHGVAGAPEAVGLMDDDQAPECGVEEFAAGAYPWMARTDASRLFFVSRGDDCDSPAKLYVRNRTAGSTTLIGPNANFIRSSVDGREALFATKESLADGDQNASRDIYRWSETEPLVCATCSVADAAVGMIKVPPSLERVYFTSSNLLVPGEGVAGKNNFYVLRRDSSIGFVAVLETLIGDSLAPGWSRITPDGRVLAFMASSRPTADAIKVDCVTDGVDTPHECAELYRYDDRDESVECVTCAPDRLTTRDFFFGAGIALSGDGETLAFITDEALLPKRDINGTGDIYEWRHGVTSLITNGVTKHPALGSYGSPQVRGTDDSGDGILFTVAGAITGFEEDRLANLYVARVGGGFDLPQPTAHCVEDGCQGALLAAPAAPRPASDDFAGRGDVRKATRQRSRCARKRARKARCNRGTRRSHHQRAKNHRGGHQ
jgi:hypothetical protein